MSTKGLVYFIITAEGGEDIRCKIGFTAGEPNDRLRALQSGSPTKLAIYCAFDGTKETEKLFHKTFAPLRVHGEWFQMRHKLTDFLLCLLDDAMTRKPADWVNVLLAAETAILANAPYRKNEDPDEYMASADTGPWRWMVDAIAAEDEEGSTLQ